MEYPAIHPTTFSHALTSFLSQVPKRRGVFWSVSNSLFVLWTWQLWRVWCVFWLEEILSLYLCVVLLKAAERLSHIVEMKGCWTIWTIVWYKSIEWADFRCVERAGACDRRQKLDGLVGIWFHNCWAYAADRPIYLCRFYMSPGHWKAFESYFARGDRKPTTQNTWPHLPVETGRCAYAGSFVNVRWEN